MAAGRAIEVAREYDLQLVEAIGLAMRGVARAAVESSTTSPTGVRDGLNIYRSTGARYHVPILAELVCGGSAGKEGLG